MHVYFFQLAIASGAFCFFSLGEQAGARAALCVLAFWPLLVQRRGRNVDVCISKSLLATNNQEADGMEWDTCEFEKTCICARWWIFGTRDTALPERYL